MRSSLLVAVGGATGAAIRWAVGRLLVTDGATFPWATLLVNVVGCLAIGVAAARLVRGSDLWAGLVVGVLGGLTTFSAFAVETRDLVDNDHCGTALVYVVVSVVAGLVAVEIARGVARR